MPEPTLAIEKPTTNQGLPTPASKVKSRSWLAYLGVGLLVGLALVGWLAFFLTRPPNTRPNPTATPGFHPTSQASPVSNLTVSTPNSNNNNPLPTVTPVAYGVVISKVLNLRAGPSTNDPLLTTLKSGDIVALARRSGGWYQTTEGAWISALYLEVRQTRLEAESYAHELSTP